MPVRVLWSIAIVSLLFAICRNADAQSLDPVTSQQASAPSSQDAGEDELRDWEWVDFGCPDPAQRHTTIDGPAVIAGHVYPDGTLYGKPLKFAEVRVYSSLGQSVYIGKTDRDGWFITGLLPPGNYRLVIAGWGTTAVRLRPVNEGSGGLGGSPVLLLTENECVLPPVGGN